MHIHYICPVIGTGAGDDSYRPSIADAFNDMDDSTAALFQGWVTDIPSNPSTGAPLKNWCVVAVEAGKAAHDFLAARTDIWPVTDKTADRTKVRQFLRSKGEGDEPDTPQGVLTLLHPMDAKGGVPDIANLRVGGKS